MKPVVISSIDRLSPTRHIGEREVGVDNLVENDAECPDVNLLGVPNTLPLGCGLSVYLTILDHIPGIHLRAHVVLRPEEILLLDELLPRHQLHGQAEVDELELARHQEEVPRLDVGVENVGVVDVSGQVNQSMVTVSR